MAARGLIPTTREMLVGEVLDAGFRLFRASVAKCLPCSAISVIAAQGPTFYDALRGRPFTLFVGKDLGWWVVYAISVLISVWMVGLVFLRQDSMARLEPRRLAADLGPALRRSPGAIVVSVAVLAIVVLAIAAFAADILPGSLTAVALLPAAWLGVRLAFAPYLYWCDRLGVWSSLTQSFRLVSGHFWRTAAMLIVLLMTLMVFYFVVAIMLAVLAPAVGARDAALLLALQAVVTVCVGAAGVPFASALLVVAGDELKWRRENRVRSNVAEQPHA